MQYTSLKSVVNCVADKNILDKLLSGIDITKLLGEFAPSVMSTLKGQKMGRPRKVKWDDKVAKGVVGGKLALAFAGAVALERRGEVSPEMIWAVLGYASERITSLSIVECFPSSEKWVVREALKTFGLDVPVVSWDEVMSVIGDVADTIQASQGAGRVDMGSLLQRMRASPQPVGQQPVG